MSLHTALSYVRTPVQRGYTNRILRIDLSKRIVDIEEVSSDMRERFIGGRGYCLKLVFDGTRAGTRHDSPENVLALAGGPFCGETAWPGTGKFIAGAISPLTGTFCDSNVGGHFFPLVKLSGFDAISITGKSAGPVMVLIDGDGSEVRILKAPGGDLSFLEAENFFEQWKGRGEVRNVAVLTTGKGAATTHFGCLNSVYYDVKRKRCRSKQAGRGGMGTVMRGKGLWGIVVRNNASKALANDPAEARRLRETGNRLRSVIRDVDPKAMRMYAQGTTSLIDMMNASDILPVNNYQFGRSEHSGKVSGEVFEKDFFRQGMPDGCFAGCTLACTKGCDRHVLTTGPLKGKTVGVDGPEYETAAAVTNLGIFDPRFMLDYSWYCDEYGLDTISAGVTIAFLLEAFERGHLTAEDTEGLTLGWGNVQAISDLLHRIAEGTGFGGQAGRGVRYLKGWIAQRCAARTGRPAAEIREELSRYAMECKGLEFSLYVTKESLAQQGGYGFALKGAQHDEAWLIALDQIRNEMPTFELKARALKWFPLFRTWFNVAGLCKLPWIDVRHPEAKNTEEPAKNLPTVAYYVELVGSTLGRPKKLEELLLESERVYTLHKLFNLRQGCGTREHDRIPLRAMAPVYMNEFLSRKSHYEKILSEVAGEDLDGKSDEEKLRLIQEHRLAQYEKLCDAVYAEKGYDREGVPLKSTLLNLGFEEPELLALVENAHARG
ncbi:MAG: aldehyde ferredoxin oxidoreductase C-terminal domain-containing protein [bacterium]